MRVDFQNENLVAYGDGQPVAAVPDLICIVAADDAEPITTELLRYCQGVAVVGPPRLRLRPPLHGPRPRLPLRWTTLQVVTRPLPVG
jgi:DUF917 family protein